MDTTFAYLRDVDDAFFITLGDAHPDETVSCLPVYTPDEDGDRSYNGTTLSKAAKDGSAALPSTDDPSPIRFGALEVPRSRIEEVVDPYRDRCAVLDNMDTESRAAYEAIDDAVDAELMVIGSDTYGVGTSSSDLDLVWLGDYDAFEEQKATLMAETGLEEVGEAWLDDRIADHAERYQVPEAVARYHHETPQQRFFSGDLKVGFSPSQVPGTYKDAPRPAPDAAYEDVRLEATVTDTEHMGDWPRTATLTTEDGDTLELSTYFWAYGGSFEEGDDLVIEGDTTEGEDVIHLREPGHFAAPEDHVPDG